ncbi:MAG: type II toxin-antitoxin system death-on-curing family toxin [Planctomycetota bacterium]|jgi:death-on-curing protein
MAEPVWIRMDAVLAVHQRQLAEHGGEQGIRDAALLESALARPKNLLAYGEGDVDVPRLAAAYAYGLAKNHPFVDGNKRVAWVVCRMFLKLNGCDVDAPKQETYTAVMRLAEGNLAEDDLADWIRRHL